MNRNPKILKYVAFLMLFASMVLIVLGVYFYMKEDAFLKECTLITCKITEIEEKRLGRATLTLKEVNGNYPPFKYYITYDASEDELGYEEGEIVDVYYYKQDISRSEIKDFFTNHLTSFILIIIGFVFMIDFPIMLFVAGIARKKQQNAQPVSIDRTTIISE